MLGGFGKPKRKPRSSFGRLFGDVLFECSLASIFGGFLEVFCKAFFFDFFRCWVDFGRFWEAKTEAKIDFWEVFFRCFFRVPFGIDFVSIFQQFFFGDFFERVLASILGGFLEARNLKNQ